MSQNMPAVHLREATVFVVDDDDGLCEGLCDLLESVGLNSTRFGSAEEFIGYWRDDMPRCLMLDARLPGMTGVDFQEKLVRGGVRIPIIFMTGHGDVPMVRKVMKAGAVEFLTKPFRQGRDACCDPPRLCAGRGAARRAARALRNSGAACHAYIVRAREGASIWKVGQ